MIDQIITDATYSEKPGVGCIDTLRLGSKGALIATGGFDHRIKISSLKTLKLLVHLNFHDLMARGNVIAPGPMLTHLSPSERSLDHLGAGDWRHHVYQSAWTHF